MIERDGPKRPGAALLIKRYAQGRLYDGERARYVSLDELRAWTAGHRPLQVLDAATGEDVTRAVLD